jgi:hypothetical protein
MVRCAIRYAKIPVVLGVFMALVIGAGPVAAAAPACGSWTVVSSPNVGTGNNQFIGVAAISSSDVWAVGSSAVNSTTDQTLIEQYNGTSWNVVPSPNVGSGSNDLLGVTAVSASDVWSVGRTTNSSGVDQTLIEQYNGTSWNVVSSPNVGSGNNDLLAVSADSANDVWAVGRSTDSSGNDRTLVEHYNGTSWSVVSSPNNGSHNNDLIGVVAIAPNNVWAVGTYANFLGQQFTLTEHWNGSSWSIVSSPSTGVSSVLTGVAAINSTNLVAVGLSVTFSGTFRTLVEHWNGSKWSIVSSPNVGSGSNVLGAVSVISSSNIWFVGYSTNSSGVEQTLIEHWNGHSLSVVSSPNVGSGNNVLTAISRVPGTTSLWTVGASTNSSGATQTLTEFFC